MLKLEKASKSHLSIILRDKERFFSRPLLTAFAIALAFHLTFIVLFKVTSVAFPWNETVFPPIQVDAESSFKNVAVLSEINLSSQILSKLPLPKPPMPSQAEHPTFTHPKQIEYIKEDSLSGNFFTQMEKEIYTPSYLPLAKKNPPLLRLYVTGKLANRTLLSKNDETASLNSLKETITPEEQRLIYSVYIDEHSGKIFWYEAKQRSNIPLLNNFSEEMLKSLVFAHDPQAFVTAGEVEMHFNLGASHD